MTAEPQFALVPVEHLTALTAEVRALRQAIDGATIKPAPEWLSISKAAAALGVSTATVRRRIETGEMKARGSGKLREVKVT